MWLSHYSIWRLTYGGHLESGTKVSVESSSDYSHHFGLLIHSVSLFKLNGRYSYLPPTSYVEIRELRHHEEYSVWRGKGSEGRCYSAFIDS